MPGVVAVSWMGFSAPARTPQAIVSRLEAEIMAIVTSSDFQTRVSEPVIGMTPLPLGADKFVGFIQNEIRVWTPVIQAGNIKAE